MTNFGTSGTQLETFCPCYDSGVVTLYSLPESKESIILRVASLEGSEPRDGEKYIVEFVHSKTGELLEVLEGADSRLFDPKSIHSVADELAEQYLRSVAEEWEAYVAQSGRCAPNEINVNAAKLGSVVRTVIRDH